MVSPVTVRQWAQKGWLKAELTAGGHRRFLIAEVKRFARERGLTLQLPDDDQRQRILIVDDNEKLAGYLVELFHHLPDAPEVEVAYDGFEAGGKVEAFQPHIVLLDLMMPGLDGFTVCKRLKQDPTTRAIRIIAMTGYASPENIQHILEAGAEACLVKPFEKQDLLDALGISP